MNEQNAKANESMEAVSKDEMFATEGGGRYCQEGTLGLSCRESDDDIFRLQ